MRIAPRVSGFVAIAVGVLTIVGGLSVFGPGRAAKGDRLIALVAGELTDQGLTDHTFDLDTWEAATRQLQDEAIPWLADGLGIDSSRLVAILRDNVPAVAAALDVLPDALPFARRILDNLTRQQDNFRAAQDLPVPGVSLEAGSWMLVLTGVVLVVLGVLVLVGAWTGPMIGLGVVATVLVVAPLATGFIPRANKARDLLETLNFDRQVAVETRDFFEATRDLIASIDGQILPSVARSGGIDVTVLAGAFHDRFPDVARAIDHQAEIADRFEARVEIREQAVDDLAEVKKVPLRALGWLVVAAGSLVLVATGADLVRTYRRRRGCPSGSPS